MRGCVQAGDWRRERGHVSNQTERAWRQASSRIATKNLSGMLRNLGPGLQIFVDLLDEGIATSIPHDSAFVVILRNILEEEGIVTRGGMRGDHFVLAFALLDEFGYAVADVDEHVSVRDDIGSIHHRTVAGDHPGIGSTRADGHA